MLTLAQLQQLYPSVHSQKSILVEYLQHELLDSIYKQPGSERLSFIGGTAVRIVYGGSRFSEDLDFDNLGLSFDEFTALSQHVVDDMHAKGFTVEFRLVEKGAYHCYIKFPKILLAAGMAVDEKEKILVRIDTVQKEKLVEPVVYTLNAFDIYRDILVNPIDVLLSQKLIAILQRKRERGRDFYDVSYLYGMTQPNARYIESYLKTPFADFQKMVVEKCATLDFAYLATDVEPFLMKPEDTQRVKDFQRFIKEKFLG